MKTHQLAPCALIFAYGLFGQSIEPQAGTWKTWIISSGKDFRVPPPPDAGTTAGELRWLHDAVAEPNPQYCRFDQALERRCASLPVDRAHQQPRLHRRAPYSLCSPRLYLCRSRDV